MEPTRISRAVGPVGQSTEAACFPSQRSRAEAKVTKNFFPFLSSDCTVISIHTLKEDSTEFRHSLLDHFYLAGHSCYNLALSLVQFTQRSPLGLLSRDLNPQALCEGTISQPQKELEQKQSKDV